MIALVSFDSEVKTISERKEMNGLIIIFFKGEK